jgi:hypothetical protein
MNLKQAAHFLRLKKAYAYDLALAKPSIGVVSDEDMYESLCLLDLCNSLTDKVNEFMDEYESIHPGEEIVCLITAVSFLLNNMICCESNLESDRKELKILFDSLYESISKEKDDEI